MSFCSTVRNFHDYLLFVHSHLLRDRARDGIARHGAAIHRKDTILAGEIDRNQITSAQVSGIVLQSLGVETV